MSIYDAAPASTSSVRGMQKRAAKNPAKALYDYWLTVLEGQGVTHIRLGDLRLDISGRVDDKGRPVIVTDSFHLNASGEFQLWNMHGSHQRNIVARSTFLQWAHFRSAYNWYVNPQFKAIGWYGSGDLSDWRAPARYVSEDLIQSKVWRGEKPWLKLLQDATNGGWYIWLARDAPTKSPYAKKLTEADFMKFEALRLRRYWLMERKHRIESGEWDHKGRHIPTPEEREERQTNTVSLLMAHLDVSTPARTVPLRKTPEEEGLWQLNGSR